MAPLLLLLSLLLSNFEYALGNIRGLQFASPLQSLTIPDEEAKETLNDTPRSRFLPKFRLGLKAEVQTRRKLMSSRTKEMTDSARSDPDWAKKAADAEEERRDKEDEIVEQVYDTALASLDAGDGKEKKSKSKKSVNEYQFVGVIDPKEEKKPISWYARKKPSNAKWSVRLVHVNKDVIIKDLFDQGKVDIFATYKNTGKVDEETNTRVVTAKYEVRERSWK